MFPWQLVEIKRFIILIFHILLQLKFISFQVRELFYSSSFS